MARVVNLQRTNLVLLTIILLLLGFGLNILLASSAFIAEKEFNDAYFYIKRQGVYTLVGLIFMVFLSQVNYEVWQKVAWPL